MRLEYKSTRLLLEKALKDRIKAESLHTAETVHAHFKIGLFLHWSNFEFPLSILDKELVSEL